MVQITSYEILIEPVEFDTNFRFSIANKQEGTVEKNVRLVLRYLKFSLHLRKLYVFFYYCCQVTIHTKTLLYKRINW